jgi:hypothetical protein
MTSDQPPEIDQPVAMKIDLDALTAAGASDHAMETLLEENAREFARHVDAWMAEFKPATPSEIQLIRHAASLAWKLDRADRYEEAVVAQRASDSILARLESSQPRIEHAVALASFDPSSEAERVRRYRLAVHRELRKDLESFAKLRLHSEKQNLSATKVATEADLVTPNKPNSAIEAARCGSPNSADSVDRRSPAAGQGVDTPRSPVSSARRGSDPAASADRARRGSPDPADFVDPAVNRPLNPRAKRRPNLEQIIKERKRAYNNRPEAPRYVKVGDWSLSETLLLSKRG